MDDDLTSPDAPTPRLWVRLAPGWTPDARLRWVIAGSAHTHRGHFHVCSESGDHHRSVNLGDVIEMSPDAAVWLNGFLHGQEPDSGEFLGGDGAPDATDDDLRRWREWNRRFRTLGFAPSDLEPLPARTAGLDRLGAPTPWCYVGDLYRVWSDGDWRAAQPQPATDDPSGWFWPGSGCAAIGEHSMCDDAEFSYCEGCHLVAS